METAVNKQDFFYTRKNSIILFCINLAYIGFLNIKIFSWVGLGASLAILGILYKVMVYDNSIKAPALKYVNKIIIADFIMMIFINYQRLLNTFSLNSFEYWLSYSPFLLVMLLVVGGFILYGVFTSKQNAIGLAIAQTMCLSSFTIVIWKDLSGSGKFFMERGFFVCVSVIAIVFFWYFLVVMSANASNMSIDINKGSSVLFLIISFVMIVSEYDVIHYLAGRFIFDIFPQFTWMKVIIAVVVLLLLAVAMLDRGATKVNADTICCVMVAGALVLIKIWLDNYFIYGVMFIVAFLFATTICVKANMLNKKVAHLSPIVFMGVQTVVWALLLLLSYFGFMVNVAITVVLLVILVARFNVNSSDKENSVNGILALVGVALEFLAWAYTACMSKDIFIAIGVIFAVTLGLMLIHNTPLPDNASKTKGTRAIICGAFAILCFCAVLNKGTSIDITFDTANSSVLLNSTSDKHNEPIVETSYYWSSSRMNKLTEVTNFGYDANGNAVIPIMGDMLTVCTVNSKGVKTTQTAWIPLQLD